jgi:hypothetical protein
MSELRVVSAQMKNYHIIALFLPGAALQNCIFSHLVTALTEKSHDQQRCNAVQIIHKVGKNQALKI